MKPNSETQPFTAAVKQPAAWHGSVLVVLLTCLTIGGVAMVWRARNRAAPAETAALALAARLESSLARAAQYADALGAGMSQAADPVVAFPGLAGRLCALHPELALLDLAPGGVIRDTWPRAGYERLIGQNLLKDAAASEALRRHSPQLQLPVVMPGGSPSLVCRFPLFRPSAAGRETFWGFGSVWIRLHNVFNTAPVEEVLRQGFDYVLFTPAAPGKPSTILASQGTGSFSRGVVRTLQVQNLELKLAVKPHGAAGGWLPVFLDLLAVCAVAGLAAVTLHLFQARSKTLDALEQAQVELASVKAATAQATQDWREAEQRRAADQAELKESRAELQEARACAGALQEQLEAAARKSAQALETTEALIKREQSRAASVEAELKSKCDAAQQTLSSTATELEEVRSQLQQLKRTSKESEAKLLADLAAQREEAAGLRKRMEAEQKRAAALEAKLEAAERAALEGAEQVAELETRLAAAATARAIVEATKPELELEPESAADSQPATAEPEVKNEPITEPPLETSNAVEAEPLAVEPVAVVASTPEAAVVAASEETRDVPPAGESSVSSDQTAGKGAGRGRRKKTKYDPQMDLFGSPEPEPDTQLSARPPGREQKKGSGEPAETPSSAPRSKASREARSSPAPPEPGPDRQAEAKPAELVSDKSEKKPDLPQIEGVDVAEGVTNAGGDVDGYLEALKRFSEKQAGVSREIRDALMQSEVTEAEQKLRALKLAAADIGAGLIHNAAIALSKAIASSTDPVDVEFAWAELDKALGTLLDELDDVLQKEKAAPVRKAAPPPPVSPAVLRKAVNEIFPLFAGQDPGAKDCLKANRNTFRSAFSPEAFTEFEQLVKGNRFEPASELLQKTAKRHGISI